MVHLVRKFFEASDGPMQVSNMDNMHFRNATWQTTSLPLTTVHVFLATHRAFTMLYVARAM